MDSYYIFLFLDRIYRINWIFFWLTFRKKVSQSNPPAAEAFIGCFAERPFAAKRQPRRTALRYICVYPC